MEGMLERVAGLDVHKQTVAVCIKVPGDNGERHQHVRTFGARSGTRPPITMGRVLRSRSRCSQNHGNTP
jgi:hypothetical protein